MSILWEMAELTAKRSTCMRRNVGAVIVKEKHAIATGYNGAPRGIKHCEERGRLPAAETRRTVGSKT